MTKLGGEFDATRIEPEQQFEVLPAGKYLVQAVDSDVRNTKDGAGTYLWFEFEVLDGPRAGRKLWDRINQENPSQQAKTIGERRFSALCHATGKLRVSDTAELHNIPVIATVQVRPAEGQYAESNAIRGYSPAQESQTAAAPVRRAPIAPGEPEARVVPASAPWKRARG